MHALTRATTLCISVGPSTPPRCESHVLVKNWVSERVLRAACMSPAQSDGWFSDARHPNCFPRCSAEPRNSRPNCFINPTAPVASLRAGELIDLEERATLTRACVRPHPFVLLPHGAERRRSQVAGLKGWA